jgi:cell division protein ZipA
MNELRWILIICGALLLLGIYLWGRVNNRKSSTTRESLSRTRSEPQLEPAPMFEPAPLGAADFESAELDSDEGELVADTPEPARAPASQPYEARRRVEPTFDDQRFDADQSYDPIIDDENMTAELPARESTPAPTLAMSESPAPRRIERRKIIALRLAAPSQHYAGQQLLEALAAEGLQYGKYDVFHRYAEDGAVVFSVASMVEPGTFDVDHMPGTNYAGITLFAQLPGPIPGVHALQELITCGKRLLEVVGGTLQDERGVPLTVHRTERLRQEVVEFERAQTRDQGRTPTAPSF